MIMSLPQASTAPRWMQTFQYALQPLNYLDQAIQQGVDIVNMPGLGNRETIALVCHPEGLKQLFTNRKCIKAPANGLIAGGHLEK